MIEETYLYNLKEQERLRIEEQERLFDYYVGNKSAIIEYLEEALCISFDDEDVAEMQKYFINFTKKIINQISIVYREPAKRYFIDNEGNEIEDSTMFYKKVIPVNVNSIDKTALRYAKLFNTSLTRLYFDKGKIKYLVLPSHLYQIETSE
jgi:hypothetical protein